MPEVNVNGLPEIVKKALLKAVKMKESDTASWSHAGTRSSQGWPQTGTVELALELIKDPTELKKLQEKGESGSSSRLSSSAFSDCSASNMSTGFPLRDLEEAVRIKSRQPGLSKDKNSEMRAHLAKMKEFLEKQ